MSLPQFPDATVVPSREEAINQIISSIAMEELALSHIINAEGEKLQYILGTLTGTTGPQPTIEQVLEVNESVRGVLEAAAETQSVLRSKLQNALSASTLRGATGATGSTGADGVVVAQSYQSAMSNTVDPIVAGQRFDFSTNLYAGNTSITYDAATMSFTIEPSEYDYYEVTWWIFTEGYGDTLPFEITLFVDDEAHTVTTIPFVDAQMIDSTYINVTESTNVYLSNTSVGDIMLFGTGNQAKISFVGYKSNP